MTEITIPNTVDTIESSAFAHCENLKKIVIPASVTTLDKNILKSSSLAVIYCYKDSEAHKFAEENNIKYVLISDSTDSQSDTDTSKDTDSQSDTDTSKDTDSQSDTDTVTDTDSEETTDKPTHKNLIGDVDGDGKISAKDSMQIQRYVINIKKLDDTQLKAADVNNDNKVTNKDALDILRYTIHMSKNDNIGKSAQ